ncbi:AGAMOUS-like MADS-box protein [Rhynchospora pubera]|uniref:AGAMOUS-like MADS-box protein n=1 Tax=Rhynchospora pubera TaxID=906938 RepID=A0AAV8BS66_9POAL|nr:AGAMOUS-like MADS-box protein [Rhynchospora pubera]
MPKKKTILQPIANPSIRRATFKKRKASLIKKALELSTLCHVDVCTVISQGPHDRNPETWPAGEDAMQILSRFSAIPDAEKSKRMVNLESFLLQQIEKIQVQLGKVQSENCELETGILLHEVFQGQSSIADVASIEMIVNLGAVVEMRLKEIDKRISDLPPPPVPPLIGADTWLPSVALPDPLMGFTANVVTGQGWSNEMENDWQGISRSVPGPTGVDVAPAVAGPQVEEEIERVDFSSFGFDDEMTALLYC